MKEELEINFVKWIIYVSDGDAKYNENGVAS